MASGSTVVLVPGFMGSDLLTGPSAPYGLQGAYAWGSWLTLAAGSWQWLPLDSAGQHSTNALIGDLVPGSAQDPVYGILRRFMSERGWNVVTPAQDWRQVPSADGQRLADVLTSIAGQSGPVPIIAHSRGGLVVRQAIGLLGSQAPEVISRVVGLGVPHLGSWIAVAFLAGFSPWYLQVLEVIEAGRAGLAGALINSSLAEIVATWPAVYALFPSPRDPITPPQQIAVIYQTVNWQQANPNAMQSWMLAASEGWASLPVVPDSIPWLNVIGYPFDTPQFSTINDVPTTSQELNWGPVGDGVVPTWSAKLSGRNTITTWTQHSALPRDPRILPFLDLWCSGLDIASQTIPGGPVL